MQKNGALYIHNVQCDNGTSLGSAASPKTRKDFLPHDAQRGVRLWDLGEGKEDSNYIELKLHIQRLGVLVV